MEPNPLMRVKLPTFNIANTCFKKCLSLPPLKLSPVTEMRGENHEKREQSFTRWQALIRNLPDFCITCRENKITSTYNTQTAFVQSASRMFSFGDDRHCLNLKK